MPALLYGMRRLETRHGTDCRETLAPDAALTTIAGLLSLLIAKFVGFYEFGVISAVGILFSFLTAIFAMPVFIFIAGGLPPRPRNSFFPKAWSDEKIVGFFKRAAVVGLVFSVVMAFFCPNLEFEYNFKNLC